MYTLISIIVLFIMWNVFGVLVTILDLPYIPEYHWSQWICPLRAWLIYHDEKQHEKKKR